MQVQIAISKLHSSKVQKPIKICTKIGWSNQSHTLICWKLIHLVLPIRVTLPKELRQVFFGTNKSIRIVLILLEILFMFRSLVQIFKVDVRVMDSVCLTSMVRAGYEKRAWKWKELLTIVWRGPLLCYYTTRSNIISTKELPSTDFLNWIFSNVCLKLKHYSCLRCKSIYHDLRRVISFQPI